MHPSTGVTTDARVVEGVVRFLKEQGIENVIVGEGSGFADTFQAFRVAGIDKVAERWSVKLVDLNKDPLIRVEIPAPLALKRVRVAKTALESRLVSVPKLKLHRTAGVTLSLKNMVGAVYPKGSIHSRLGEKIADLASILRPRGRGRRRRGGDGSQPKGNQTPTPSRGEGPRHLRPKSNKDSR